MTIQTLVMTKEALIERLNEQLPALRERDARLMAQHRKDEAESLKAFRAMLRDMLKWDYTTARSQGFEVPYDRRRGFKTSCPTMLAPQAERALQLLEVDRRKRYTLSKDGAFGTIFHLVTWTENPIDLSGGCE